MSTGKEPQAHRHPFFGHQVPPSLFSPVDHSTKVTTATGNERQVPPSLFGNQSEVKFGTGKGREAHQFICPGLKQAISDMSDLQYAAVKKDYEESHPGEEDIAFGTQLHIVDEALMDLLDKYEGKGLEPQAVDQALRAVGINPTARLRVPCEVAECKKKHGGIVHREHKDAIAQLVKKLDGSKTEAQATNERFTVPMKGSVLF